MAGMAGTGAQSSRHVDVSTLFVTGFAYDVKVFENPLDLALAGGEPDPTRTLVFSHGPQAIEVNRQSGTVLVASQERDEDTLIARLELFDTVHQLPDEPMTTLRVEAGSYEPGQDPFFGAMGHCGESDMVFVLLQNPQGSWPPEIRLVVFDLNDGTVLRDDEFMMSTTLVLRGGEYDETRDVAYSAAVGYTGTIRVRDICAKPLDAVPEEMSTSQGPWGKGHGVAIDRRTDDLFVSYNDINPHLYGDRSTLRRVPNASTTGIEPLAPSQTVGSPSFTVDESTDTMWLGRASDMPDQPGSVHPIDLREVAAFHELNVGFVLAETGGLTTVTMEATWPVPK